MKPLHICLAVTLVIFGVILGHRDLSPDLNGDGRITANEYLKLCPCFDAMLELSQLNDNHK